VDAIDKENKDVFVVVHLYQTYNRECVRLNSILQALAIKYPFVKFLKIVATEAKADYSDVGLPSLLVYKAGDLVQRWVPVTVKLGKTFESVDVEMLLARYKIIRNTSINKVSLMHKEKEENPMEEFDEDDDFSNIKQTNDIEDDEDD